MDSIRLINYRGLEDTGTVNIKPLTFLLGANSTGKSSFLKILPLLKQSANTNVRGSFLWNGSLVDFEDFQNVVRNGDGEIEMEFCLSDFMYLRQRFWPSSKRIPSLMVSFKLSKKEDRWDYMSFLKIETNKICLEIKFNTRQGKDYVESIIVNGSDYSSKISQILAVNYIGVIPRLLYKNKDHIDDEPESVFDEIIKLFENKEVAVDRYLIRKTIMDLPINVALNENIGEQIKRKFRKNLEWDKTKEDKLINLTCYYSLNYFIDSINEYFSCFAKNITYVAPLRANFERYYRFQNYSVEAIDADGRNLAMFLNSLGADNMKLFNQWLSRVFKFEIKLTPSVGHVAIELKEKDKEFRNLVDLGFGYTEMLPILAMVWKDVEYDKIVGHRVGQELCKQHTFAIEQPELHLHPRFQAKFAQLLVNVINDAKEQNYDVRFVIETHSDVIINKIGELIGAKGLDSNDVNVVLFNAKKEGLDKYVETTHFSEDGYIVNWPYGFFDEDEEDDAD